jgi:hypothetical protein
MLTTIVVDCQDVDQFTQGRTIRPTTCTALALKVDQDSIKDRPRRTYHPPWGAFRQARVKHMTT